jgi:carbon dioxide concentrating mechanism protein CcmL
MEVGRVVGTVVATIKAPGLNSFKLLLVSPFLEGEESQIQKPSLVAIDLVGAGEGDIVLVTSGSAARASPGSEGAPTDAAIIAVVDTVQLGERTLYDKG